MIDKQVTQILKSVGLSRSTLNKSNLPIAFEAITPATPNKAAVRRQLRKEAARTCQVVA